MQYKREYLIKIAQETLEILKDGFYISDNLFLNEIANDIARTENNTIYYSPDFSCLFDFPNFSAAKIEITNESTLSAISRLTEEGYTDICALNFASAKNPGGGFLKGSTAQEESVARASALYDSLISKPEFYKTNIEYGNCLYTDGIIYSPNVVIFRNDDFCLLDDPQYASMITCPAVNQNGIGEKETEILEKIPEIMKNRIHKILSVASLHNHRNLILGAWGCGAFGNKAEEVAKYFYEELQKFSGIFDRIIFAILDSSPEGKTIDPFKKIFEPGC